MNVGGPAVAVRGAYTMNDLQPVTPDEAVRWYLDERSDEVTETTLRSHDYRLSHFVRWCKEEAGIADLNNLDGRSLNQYRIWRREDGGLNTVTLKTQLSTSRVFLRFCESINAVKEGLSQKLRIPSLDDGEDERDVKLSRERADQILNYLERFEYASRRHTLFALFWETGMRIGAVHSIDLADFDEARCRVELRHRPDQGTTLKNGINGERMVALSRGLTDLISDYIQFQRHDVTDDEGRIPLFTTKSSRLHKSSMRQIIYCLTRPCEYTNECPHDREIENCEATKHDKASKCPSSISPHAIRRGAITTHLIKDVPEKVVSDRMDVGEDTLSKHYDRRTDEEKVEQRRSTSIVGDEVFRSLMCSVRFR